MKIAFQDPTFSFQLLRAMSGTYYKGADIGECLSTAYRIKEGDFESWYQEWLKTALLKPILIVHGGFDSTLEELYTSAAAPALERGYNCFTFEGPGQGGVIRKKRFHLDMIGKK